MNKIRLINLVTICLFFFAAVCSAELELDREFPQLINEQTAFVLINNPGRERPIFIGPVSAQEVRIVAGLRYDKKNRSFILRGNLPEDLEKKLALPQRAFESRLFSPLKKNGEPLYRHGIALFPKSEELSRQTADQWFYLPHFFDNKPNNCFVSDLGYFEFSFAAIPAQMSARLHDFVSEFSEKTLRICPKVRLNRYFLFKENFWGPVDYFTADSIEEAMELATIYPSHKLTLNKHLKDWQKKSAEDVRLVFELLRHEEYLLSQDYRLKLGLVPDFVRINFSRIDNTDIGSGQNQMVFLSIGPGINYFDDPWLQPRHNIPCPRLIFNIPLLAQMQIQFFPTYSIEPEATGEMRLQAINDFQQRFWPCLAAGNRQPVWAGPKSRKTAIDAIERELCSYGLINDSEDLAPGFSLGERNYNGNIVNNELRMANGLSLPSFLAAIIIPPNTLANYQNNFIQHFFNQTPHWQFIAGTHFKDLFIMASTPDDQGFRQAFLFHQAQFSHPLLARILRRARAAGNTRAEKRIATAIDRLVKLEHTGFFATAFARHRRKLEAEKLTLWCDYLESYRHNRNDRNAKLERFINFHNYLTEILP